MIKPQVSEFLISILTWRAMNDRSSKGAGAMVGGLIVTLEVVSKRQIAFESKAQADEKAQHTWWYVSILKRLATQPLGLRWGFETASR
jgi:hypothetical protein